MTDPLDEMTWNRVLAAAPKRRDAAPAPKPRKVKPANNGRYHLWRGQRFPNCEEHAVRAPKCKACMRDYKREAYRRKVSQ